MSYRRIRKDLQMMIDQSYQDFILALLSIEQAQSQAPLLGYQVPSQTKVVK